MSFLNTGTIRTPIVVDSDLAPHQHTPLEEYDHNCIFPIKELKTDKVIVTPFIPSLHAQAYLDGTKLDPFGIFRWLPWGPWNDLPTILRFLEEGRKDKTVALFAVLDTSTGTPVFAGVLKLYQCDLETLSAEIGNVLVLPPFRRTHVLTHALSLFLTWIFTLPAPTPSPPSSSITLSSQTPPSSSSLSFPPILNIGPGGGLGLRRAQWTSSPDNHASMNAAMRMGFLPEGILRNQWMWPVGKEGLEFEDAKAEIRLGWEVVGEEKRERKRGVAHDCWLGGITRGDWEKDGGVKELVERQIRR
ncbi:hypothetical protein BDY24DRAFT_392386 [Mrakia frigida]|uniref:GNAT family N-acetyltransferase n=1 Tax=Mrakia frigida TaxID=29902 RepID=UPI003FCC1A90